VPNSFQFLTRGCAIGKGNAYVCYAFLGEREKLNLLRLEEVISDEKGVKSETSKQNQL